MILKIYRAADAFLYLPTYIAEDLKIFDTLLKPYGVTNVQFITPENGGDSKAINLMLEENSNSKSSIAIAIADPTSFLSIRANKKNKTNCRVIAAIINKLPFWAVDHCDKIFSSIAEFNEEFNTVIHYNENLVTGSYLGNKVKNESQIENSEIVSFGEEINRLQEISKIKDIKSVAITADIISMVKGLNDDNPLTINYKFSNNGEFLTTGIITSKAICENHSEILERIIEAIQKAISFLYSSEEVAVNTCSKIAEKQKLTRNGYITDREIRQIVNLITEEKFYPADLNISKISWLHAIKALAKTQQWNEEDTNNILETSYEDYVDNRFVLKSERKIADQFGIDMQTFNNEIEQVILPLQEEQKKYQDLLSKNEKWALSVSTFLSSLRRIINRTLFRKKTLLILLILIFLVGSFLLYQYFQKKVIDYTAIYFLFLGVPFSILANLLTPKKEKKDE